MAMHDTVDTLLDRVKAIAPMLRASAAEAEAQRRLARPVVDALRQAGLYSMAHPQAFGGLEVDPLTMFRVVEEVAYHDSAAGWNMQMSVGASCFLAWLPEEGAAEILTSPPTPIVAGTLFPGSQALPVAGGYRLRGQWPFVTGSHEGHWVMCLPQIMGLFAQPRRVKISECIALLEFHHAIAHTEVHIGRHGRTFGTKDLTDEFA
jgi:alkylation response protein AidB-like acyl-CoA dehydrogenase